jgi:hypothetical protein
MKMDKIYKQYSDYILSINDLENSNFKSNLFYNIVLEHVSFIQGKEYLDLIRTEYSFIDEHYIKCLVDINDSIGLPKKYKYVNNNIECSPTSLRYIYHSLLILEHLKDLYCNNKVNIIEVGAGYGGLCLILNKIYNDHYKNQFNLNRYSIIDLPSANILQRKYLDYHKMNCVIYSAFDYNKILTDNADCDNFLISNYCFSELGSENQKAYIENLFPIINHGFITWNMIDIYDFGKSIIKIIREKPLTGEKNYFVYF